MIALDGERGPAPNARLAHHLARLTGQAHERNLLSSLPAWPLGGGHAILLVLCTPLILYFTRQ